MNPSQYAGNGKSVKIDLNSSGIYLFTIQTPLSSDQYLLRYQIIKLNKGGEANYIKNIANIFFFFLQSDLFIN